MVNSSTNAGGAGSASPLSALQQAVLAEAERCQTATGFRWLQAVGPLVATANLPLGMVILVGGAVCEALSERKDLRSARMPDEWLAQIALQQDVSPEGLALLARRLSEAGHVTVQDAVDWLGIEEEATKTRQRQAVAALPGAQQLLDRARRECGSLLDASLLERATTALRSAAAQAPGVFEVLRDRVAGAATFRR